MLPLVSSITTTVIGWMLLSKTIERLRLVVVEDLEVFLGEIRHQALLRVQHGGEQRHDLSRRWNVGLLGDRSNSQSEDSGRGNAGGHAQSGRDEHRHTRSLPQGCSRLRPSAQPAIGGARRVRRCIRSFPT